MTLDDDLEQAIGDWLLAKEAEPALLPGAFARGLPEALREPFLRELEALAAIDELATQAPPRDLPRRYGDFRVLGQLGSGAMGAVYEAEQVSTGARVALKVLHAWVAKDLRSASRFQREARTAAALRHPGIVAVLGFGETDGAAWLAMERIEGRSLQRLLAAHGDPRDVDHARARELLDDRRRLATALADAADALEFAHRHGVVHRDVKPANLMFGDDGRVVVLDFGLATALEPEAVTLTRTGDFLGTPLYMAPEQAVGAENGTAESDVWSLGAVAYECLCGSPPFAPGPLATVIDSILNREPVDPRRRRDGVPDDLARIALQCLEKEPARRYRTAAALADDLRRFVDGNPVRARPCGPVRRSLRTLRRRPGLAALAATLLLLAATAFVVWRVAVDRDRVATALRAELDLARVEELLADAPERLTVFGGASLRFYARRGLGEQITDGPRHRSPRADEALRLVERLAIDLPHDLGVLRARALARLDVGDEPERTDASIAALLEQPGCSDADRLMAAVHARQAGRDDEAARLRAAVRVDSPEVAFWLGLWHQDEQDHAAAIAAFTRALDGGGLRSEQRYHALLHRGWCRTCPDVAELGPARDDLLQAAALRPRYGTPMLLWAALRCLEARTTADLGPPVDAVTKVLADAEPWLHVLTARVLLALAEGGIVQNGPLRFGAEFSPIAVMPVPPAIGKALAGLGLRLLDGVIAKDPASFEAGYHRVTALVLNDRHAEALAEVDRLLASAPSMRRPAIELQRARVFLAGGCAPRASAAVDGALAIDPGHIAAWRFLADVRSHVGDANGELAALERAIALLAALPRDSSVSPDAAAALPELQLRRARLLAELGRVADAREVLQNADFGGALHGEFSPRVRVQRDALLARVGGQGGGSPLGAATDSPLRWLAAGTPPIAVDAAVRMALQRGWLDDGAIGRLAVAPDPAIAVVLQVNGHQGPATIADAPLQVLIANVTRLLDAPDAATALRERARALVAADPEKSEARLLDALVLHLTGHPRDAAAILAGALGNHGDDLRIRYLLAVAARAAGDDALLRLAVQRDGRRLEVPELDRAARSLPLPDRVAGAELLRDLR